MGSDFDRQLATQAETAKPISNEDLRSDIKEIGTKLADMLSADEALKALVGDRNPVDRINELLSWNTLLHARAQKAEARWSEQQAVIDALQIKLDNETRKYNTAFNDYVAMQNAKNALKLAHARDALLIARYAGALNRIAGDEKIYTGHGNYTEQPMCGIDAQREARAALDYMPVVFGENVSVGNGDPGAARMPLHVGPAFFQSAVHNWMLACFGEAITKDQQERGYRFIEESLELVQSMNMPLLDVLNLVTYVYGRDKGEIQQEIGGVCVTLAALCSASGHNLNIEATRELNRCWKNIEKIRAKHKAKKERGNIVSQALP